MWVRWGAAKLKLTPTPFLPRNQPTKQSGGHTNSFSKASFALSTGAGGAGGANAVSVDDGDFWEKVRA